MAAELRLHSKLYRAASIDEAIRIANAESPATKISRRREGAHYVVSAEDCLDDSAVELLREVADVALVLTVERDRRG